MLATKHEPFNRAGWLFEIKYDGYRLICEKQGARTTLTSRKGKDLTQTFPEIALAVSRLPYEHIVLNGEAVVLDLNGLPNFSKMQKRRRLNDTSTIQDAMRRYPATLSAFDLVAFDTHDLTDLPLSKRKDHLLALLPDAGVIKYSAHIEKDGVAMYEAAVQMGLEGVVGKKASSRYRAGRSDNRVKMRRELTDDFVIMGYKASGQDIRSLALGQHIDNKLTYFRQRGIRLKRIHQKTFTHQI